MKLDWNRTGIAALVSAITLAGGCALAADTFDPATGLITIGSIVVGDTEYRDVVVEVGGFISYSTAPATSTQDSFDPTTGRVTIRSISVGAATFTNVVITVKSVRGVGGVTSRFNSDSRSHAM